MSLVDRTEYLIEQRLSKKFDIILGNMCIKCLFLKKFNFLLNVRHSDNGELKMCHRK